MATSPTQRSLKLLREQGWTAEVVERWIPGANIRKDLFGFVDILAISGNETLAVQCTSYANVSSRVKKIAESDLVGIVRDAGWEIQVHGWRKPKHRWEVRIVDIS